MDAAVQHFAERIDDDRAHSRITFGQRIGAQKHHGSGLGGGERVADAYRVRAHQVDLQFANLVADNAHIAELAYTGCDGIGELIVGDNLIDNGARAIDGCASIGG